MIKQEHVKLMTREFIYTYSDQGYKIKQLPSGDLYDEAYDLITKPKEYVETDIKIESESEVEL